MLLDPATADLVRGLVDTGAVTPPPRVLANAGEALLGAGFLAKLPAFPHASMQHVLNLRRDLDAPLGRYRRQAAALREHLTVGPFDDVSDGPSEATNCLIKKVKRTGHGFRNFHNDRLRWLLTVGLTWRTVTWQAAPNPDPRTPTTLDGVEPDKPHPNHYLDHPDSSGGEDMTASTGDPVMLGSDGGRLITGGTVNARLLVAHDHPAYASTFEMTVAPGFDVGAHIHHNGEEMFYVIDGELDVLCFEPTDRTPPDWHAWTDPAGQHFLRGQPGAFMYVPPGVPHAFANPTDRPVTMLFQSSVAGGHENYFKELGALLAHRAGPPDPDAVRQLEARYGTEQLTVMRPGVMPLP